MRMRAVWCSPTAGFTSSNEQTMALMRFRSSMRPAASDVDEDAEEIPSQSALVPADSVAGRSLVIVIAIMTFLAALAADVAIARRRRQRRLAQRGRARGDRAGASGPRPRHRGRCQGRGGPAMRRRPACAKCASTPRRNPRRCSTPWLGEGLDLSELPTPRMIVAEARRRKSRRSRQVAHGARARHSERRARRSSCSGSSVSARWRAQSWPSRRSSSC